MRLRYPAKLKTDASGEIVVSFRDLPECLTSGAGQAEALVEARDALEEAVAGRIDDDEPIPTPSRQRNGEHLIAVTPDMAAKSAFVLTLRASGLSRNAFAQRLGIDDNALHQMLDPRHHTAANRIHRALRTFDQDLVVVSHPPVFPNRN